MKLSASFIIYLAKQNLLKTDDFTVKIKFNQ